MIKTFNFFIYMQDEFLHLKVFVGLVQQWDFLQIFHKLSSCKKNIIVIEFCCNLLKTLLVNMGRKLIWL